MVTQMTDNRFIDIESLEGQAELIARTRRTVDEIGEVQACSPDDLVRVTVTVSGLVTDVDLADETVRLDREELGRLIAATAQKASQLMAAKVAEAMAEVHRLQELLLSDFDGVDSSAADALRSITGNSRADELPSDVDPFGFYVPYDQPSDENRDDW